MSERGRSQKSTKSRRRRRFLRIDKTQKSDNEAKPLLNEQKTQEAVDEERLIQIVDEVKKSPSEPAPDQKSIMFFSSKRVKYKRKIEIAENLINDQAEQDRTIRAEDRFLKKIEKCKDRRLQRICVCPLTTCYKLTDAADAFKTFTHRINRIIFVACCPPLCCVVSRAAFWPPRAEYYFYLPPSDDVTILVTNQHEAQQMLTRKKRLKKLKKAQKCSPAELYRFGLDHPCANDVSYLDGFVLKTSMGNHIACIYIKCPNGEPRFTMLYSHPNGSDLSDHLIGVPNLRDVARFYKCDVYSYDYTGYGISNGSPSEKSMYSDIRSIYDHITKVKKIDPNKLVLLGYSIGSAATVELLRNEHEQKPAGVILQAPPASIIRVIENMIGRRNNLNNPTCCMDRFVTIDKIHEITIPVLIVHGIKDRTVPVEHGKLICERAINRVAPEWVPEASHDNIENCREIWLRIRKFVKDELGFCPKSNKADKKDDE